MSRSIFNLSTVIFVVNSLSIKKDVLYLPWAQKPCSPALYPKCLVVLEGVLVPSFWFPMEDFRPVYCPLVSSIRNVISKPLRSSSQSINYRLYNFGGLLHTRIWGIVAVFLRSRHKELSTIISWCSVKYQTPWKSPETASWGHNIAKGVEKAGKRLLSLIRR